jgi:hypothetical protein
VLSPERLREVSEATAVANGDLQDGLDRSLALVERLDGPEVADAAELRARMTGLAGDVYSRASSWYPDRYGGS